MMKRLRSLTQRNIAMQLRLWTVALEISVLMAQFPSEAIAQRSYDYRTLGLGYANIGSLLMRMGIPYDDNRASQFAVL